jgi:nitrate/nitrite-specific signal transduction histidine kinase
VHVLRCYYGRIWDSFDKIRPVLLVLKYNIQMQDMGIKDPEIVELVNQIEELERKLHAHTLHKVYPIVLNNSHILLFHKSLEVCMLLIFFFAIRSLLNQIFHCANAVPRRSSDEMFPKESRGEP